MYIFSWVGAPNRRLHSCRTNAGQGEYIRFTTRERPFSSPGGGYEQQDYTIKVLGYQKQGGIKIAREVSAIWNLPEGDFAYWKGTLKEIKFY